MKNRILKELEEYCKGKCEFYENCKCELEAIDWYENSDLKTFDISACCRYAYSTDGGFCSD